MTRKVSIPFKRESTCARNDLTPEESLKALEFQFPSNGKAHVHGRFRGCVFPLQEVFQFPSNGKAHVHEKATVAGLKSYLREVSIPFKRESTCAPIGFRFHGFRSSQFQFPSNGKAHVHENSYRLLVL